MSTSSISPQPTGHDLAAPYYLDNTESILCELVRGGRPLVTASLHGKPVYIVADIGLAREIFEDSRNFSFAPVDPSVDQALTEGARAFFDEGLDSPLLSSSYDAYKESRRLFNLAFRRGYGDRAAEVDAAARRHLAALLDETAPPRIDALALCQHYWLPLAADVIGIGALSLPELELLAASARALVEGNGLQGDRASIERLAQASDCIVALIVKAMDTAAVPAGSALGSLLEEFDRDAAIAFARTFVLGGIDTGSSALALQTRLLASDHEQRELFLGLDSAAQRQAMTELAAKEAPTLYTPRFAVRDVEIAGVRIPAGAFVQLAIYAFNRCANPDFDVRRAIPGACPLHRNDTLPFGHARHKCPGEALARHLGAIFLDGLFRRYDVTAIAAFTQPRNTFARSTSELLLEVCVRE